MGASILNDGGNFRTTMLGDTTWVIVYSPICLSVNFLDGQLILRFLVLSHTWSPSLYFRRVCMHSISKGTSRRHMPYVMQLRPPPESSSNSFTNYHPWPAPSHLVMVRIPFED